MDNHMKTGFVAYATGMLWLLLLVLFDWPMWLAPLCLAPLLLAVLIAIVEDSRKDLDARSRPSPPK